MLARCGWIAGSGKVMGGRGEVFGRYVQVGRFRHTQVLGTRVHARSVDIKAGDLNPQTTVSDEPQTMSPALGRVLHRCGSGHPSTIDEPSPGTDVPPVSPASV